MSSVNLTFRLVAILSLLTILNMIFLGFTWQKKDQQDHACSVDDVIEGVAKYVQHNRAHSLEQDLINPCKKSELSEKTKETLLSALKNVVEICRSSQNETIKHLNKIRKSPIITLFTTWSRSADVSKDSVHNITFTNWVSFRPKVEIVLFTNDTNATNFAESFRINTFPILHYGGGGAPVLRTMFKTVHKQFASSPLYGYVNSDILFTDRFINTLETVLNNRSLEAMSKPLLLVGKRVNVCNITASEASSYEGIEHAANTRGAMFGPNAEDYFITNKAFPWDQTADVVVGRVAYDNWLVGHAICQLGVDVIDLSLTALAVHQTTSDGGNFEGFKHKHAHYNEALFKKVGINPVYETGFTICAQQLTHLDLCGNVNLSKRSDFWDKCKCPTRKSHSPLSAANVSKSA